MSERRKFIWRMALNETSNGLACGWLAAAKWWKLKFSVFVRCRERTMRRWTATGWQTSRWLNVYGGSLSNTTLSFGEIFFGLKLIFIHFKKHFWLICLWTLALRLSISWMSLCLCRIGL